MERLEACPATLGYKLRRALLKKRPNSLVTIVTAKVVDYAAVILGWLGPKRCRASHLVARTARTVLGSVAVVSVELRR
jgi:hypothetical protein